MMTHTLYGEERAAHASLWAAARAATLLHVFDRFDFVLVQVCEDQSHPAAIAEHPVLPSTIFLQIINVFRFFLCL